MSEEIKMHKETREASPVVVVVIGAVIGLALVCGLFVYYGMPLIVRWLTS